MILKDFLRYPGVIHTFQSIVKGKEIKNFQILPLDSLFQSIDKGKKFKIAYFCGLVTSLKTRN